MVAFAARQVTRRIWKAPLDRKLDFSEPVQGRVWKYYLLIYLLVYSTELATPRQEPIGAVTIPRCRLTTSPIRCGSLDTRHTTFMHSVEHGELSAMLLDPSMSLAIAPSPILLQQKPCKLCASPQVYACPMCGPSATARDATNTIYSIPRADGWPSALKFRSPVHPDSGSGYTDEAVP